MKFTYHQKKITLADEQKEYMEEKLLTLKKFKVLADESVLAKIDIEKYERNSTGFELMMKAHLSVPATAFHAEVEANTPEEAIDLLEGKLRTQLEKYKETH